MSAIPDNLFARTDFTLEEAFSLLHQFEEAAASDPALNIRLACHHVLQKNDVTKLAQQGGHWLDLPEAIAIMKRLDEVVTPLTEHYAKAVEESVKTRFLRFEHDITLDKMARWLDSIRAAKLRASSGAMLRARVGQVHSKRPAEGYAKWYEHRPVRQLVVKAVMREVAHERRTSGIGGLAVQTRLSPSDVTNMLKDCARRLGFEHHLASQLAGDTPGLRQWVKEQGIGDANYVFLSVKRLGIISNLVPDRLSGGNVFGFKNPDHPFWLKMFFEGARQ